MKVLSFIFATFLFVSCSSGPSRPSSVPAEAFFVGGADGGVFLHCRRNPEGPPTYFCRVYRDTNGELIKEGDFAVVEGGPAEFDPSDPKLYNFYDGRIVLRDYRILEKLSERADDPLNPEPVGISGEELERWVQQDRAAQKKAIDNFLAENHKGWALIESNHPCVSKERCDLVISNGNQTKVIAVRMERMYRFDKTTFWIIDAVPEDPVEQ